MMADSLVFASIFCLVLLLLLILFKIFDRAGARGKNQCRIKEMVGKAPVSMKKNGRSRSGQGKNGSKTTVFSLQRLEYLLISAGLNISARMYILIPVCTGTVTAMAASLLTRTLVLSLALFALSILIPAGFLFFKKKQLEQKIIREIPEAVGIIVRALQIGRHVDGALKDAAGALSGPLSTEIRIIYQEMAMGFSFERAFHNFEIRYRALPDVKLFCTAFIIQRETGGNLVQVLESLADTIQKRFVFKRKIKTYTAEARMSALIIALLPFLFALFVWLFNPDYLSRLTSTTLGHIMIYAALGFEIVGFLVMRKMAELKI